MFHGKNAMNIWYWIRKKRENTAPIYIPFELSVIQTLKCIFKHMAYQRTRHLFLAMALLGFWERRAEVVQWNCAV